MNTQNHQFAEHTAITASVVPDELRIGFWSQYFGSIPQWIILEPTVFAWMDRFCTDYSGGIWNFYTLSNGGAFMAPEVENDELWSLFNTMNGNGGDMSAEAAGIAVCLMKKTAAYCTASSSGSRRSRHFLALYSTYSPGWWASSRRR